MVHNTKGTSRRDILKAAGTAAATTGLMGMASASEGNTVEVNVGFTGKSGRRAAASAAANVTREFAFDAMTIEVNENAIQGLQRRGDVRYVEANGTMHALAPKGGNGGSGGTMAAQQLPWGVDRVDAEVAHANGYTGAGADIAILDTGIDSNHPDLVDNLGTGKAFTKAKGNFAENWDDDNDHGTHCAGSAGAVNNGEGVVGVSTEATLHAVKVLGKRGSGSFSDIAAGVEWTADQGYDVGSMSLGASSGSQTLADACQYAVDKGTFLVGAAGNSGPCTDCVGYPAAYDTVMAVGSTTSSDGLSSFSSTGPEVEIAAPGSNIYSTIPGGSYDTFSGTSMATPHVAGAAGLLAATGSSNTQIRSQLTSTAEDIGLASNESGSGLLDAAAAVGVDSSDN
ncbi:subtilisin [Halogranum rubrum]|uniref:Subtilisin n=1 Tax=Halogranum rubrum TaxID=553466 RepID=A0A1I4F463_9EURY|nr:S8 family peptidase [Halogranum rubrum]SFL11637.1 subtilisin [Halogranum rubrum]